MARQTIKTYLGSGSFTAPGGCTSVQIQAIKRANSIICMRSVTDGVVSTFAVDPTGAAYAWGGNTEGQLGIASVTPASSPTLVVGALTWRQLFAEDNNIGGLATNGNVYMWGANLNGQLGNSGNVAVSSPALVVGGLTFYRMFQATSQSNSPNFTAGLTQGGQLWFWGAGTSGNFGNNAATVNVSSPVQVVGGLTFMDLAISGLGSSPQAGCIALTTTGQAYSWGRNDNGQLGQNNVTMCSSPIAVVGGLTFAKIFADTNAAFFGVTLTGQMYAWGVNGSGQLGVNDVVPRSSPTLIVGGLTWRSVYIDPAGSGSTIFALDTAGRAWAWGFNSGNGIFGNNNSGSTNASSPVQVVGGLFFQKLAVIRGQSVFGLTTSGLLYAWGANANGQLGQNSITKFSSPVQVVGGLTWADVSATFGVSVIGLTTQGVLYSWGANLNGQLGQANVTASSSPTLVVGSKLWAVQPTLVSTTVPVVPGQTYTVLMQPYFASFGGIVIGNSGLDQVDVIYDA
jgi:alpha-tubulin suppressor-like RCC1 family protein